MMTLLLAMAMQVGAPPRQPTADEHWPPGLHAPATAVVFLWLDPSVDWRYAMPDSGTYRPLVAADCDLQPGAWYAGIQAGVGILEFPDTLRYGRACRVELPPEEPGLILVVQFFGSACNGENPGPCRSWRIRPHEGAVELGTPLAPERVEVR